MRRLFLLSTLACASVARAEAPAELSEERARQILPRADLSGLNGQQRAQFLEIAGDTFDYAGCNDTLARCLSDSVKDRHAPRMAQLVKALLLEGYTPSVVIETIERYYSAFPKRQKLREDDCAALGDPKAPISVVEYSDFQCPHCAAALKPLHDMVDALPGKVRLCSKHFPLPSHARAPVAAGCAEFAQKRGKFWEMSELLFSHQEELDDGQLKSLRGQVRLDHRAAEEGRHGGRRPRHPYALLQRPAVRAAFQDRFPRLLRPGRGGVAAAQRLGEGVIPRASLWRWRQTGKT
jgi:protein-disulfide isomerase